MKWLSGLTVCLCVLGAQDLWAAAPGLQNLLEGEGYSTAIKLFLLLTFMSFVPSMMLTMTCFTRLVIVFMLLRNAMGTQQAPPNRVIMALALFLTIFVMQPIFVQINEESLVPYLDGQIDEREALDKALVPMRGFMLNQTRSKDLALFVEISKTPPPSVITDVSTVVLIPAYITSELKTAFEISFLLYVPFLVIDMCVASVLMSMGMMLLPPVMISLPFKLMLFVLVDGWLLIIDSLVKTF